jgi:hypothetical protein
MKGGGYFWGGDFKMVFIFLEIKELTCFSYTICEYSFLDL